MCCTIPKKVKHNIDLSKTKIYERDTIILEAIEEEGAEYYFFEYGQLKFGVIFRKNYVGGMGHISCHGMSRGHEAFTETGYKSIFVATGEGIVEAELEEYMKSKLLESGINLDKPKPILSQVNKVVELIQPSLFG
jgi:hypothetical protein